MEIYELNHLLAELTEHEKRYRDGQIGPQQAPSQGSQTDGRIDMVGKNRVFIKQNSRFKPVSTHTHSDVEISYVYTGACPQTVADRTITLMENQVLLLDTDCPHRVEALGENDIMVSVMLSRELLAQCLMDAGSPESVVSRFLINALAKETDHHHYVLFYSEGNRRIRRFFQELLCEYFDPTPASEQIMPALLKLIFMELVNIYEADYTKRVQGSRRASVIPIIRYIEQNYRTCTLKQVADRFFISPNYVNTLLKRHAGMTYTQTVQAQRLSHAASQLRKTGRAVEDIARECGYENLSFFYRKFTEQYGCRPGAYRAARQE